MARGLENPLVRLRVLGNDYLGLPAAPAPLEPHLVRQLCGTAAGQGARAVLAPVTTLEAETGMRAVAADGSEIAICADCLLAFAMLARAEGWTGRETFGVWTCGGTAEVRVPPCGEGRGPVIVELEMPWVDAQAEEIAGFGGTARVRNVHFGAPLLVAETATSAGVPWAGLLRQELGVGANLPVILAGRRGHGELEVRVDPPGRIGPGTAACVAASAAAASDTATAWAVQTEAGRVRVVASVGGRLAVAATVLEVGRWRWAIPPRGHGG